MCQAAVYLDGEKIMDNVLVVEPLPEGVRLIKLFEADHLVPATIRRIDLMKNQIILETQSEADGASEE
jgi:predicted RNA-binding protein